MSDLIITEDPSNYPVPDEGLQSAVLIDAVDLGTLPPLGAVRVSLSDL